MTRHRAEDVGDRCLVCHNTAIAVVALFVPDGVGAAVPYGICPACWTAFSPAVLAGLAEHLLTERTP